MSLLLNKMTPLLTMNNHIIKTCLLGIFFLFYNCGDTSNDTLDPSRGIEIFEENPFYWSYQGQPTLLLGGSVDDNLFQIDGLEAHLDEIQAAGGNYIRCTMSSRDADNLKPYSKNEEGLYDLGRPNPAYWEKLQKLLELCKERSIIVQIEIWATYDFYWGENRWANNPFNPKLNVNYNADNSHLPDSIAYPAQTRVNPFFNSIPELDNNQVLLPYQKAFVDQLMSISLNYNNVLYCVDNETNAHYEWGRFWSDYLRDKASEFGKKIYITEMWDSWDPTNGAIEGAKYQHPDLGGWYAEHTNPELHEFSNYSYSISDTLSYDFVDISNHNAQDGQVHYDTGLWVREFIAGSGKIRPINNVKIYGADISQLWSGTVREGQERFWRNIFAGHASVRFHRPSAGIGLSDLAKKNIRSMRMLTGSVDFFSFVPANEMLKDRDKNEAYCMQDNNGNFLVYFPSGGVVKLDVAIGEYSVRGLRISKSFWMEDKIIQLPGVLAAPHDESWAFLIKRR